ncbi:MAG: hypothetical protein RSB39_09930, partial [Oscillospiraceae bacterium]
SRAKCRFALFAAGRHAGLFARATSWRGLLLWLRMGRGTKDEGTLDEGIAPKGRGEWGKGMAKSLPFRVERKLPNFQLVRFLL